MSLTMLLLASQNRALRGHRHGGELGVCGVVSCCGWAVGSEGNGLSKVSDRGRVGWGWLRHGGGGGGFGRAVELDRRYVVLGCHDEITSR